MSAAEAQAQSAETVETKELSFLDQAIAATKQTDPDRTAELLRTLTQEALAGTLTYSKNLAQTINAAITAIDGKLSAQLNAIMHHADFQKLEGTWRGLNHLVMNSETGSSLKIRVLNCTKKELYKSLTKASEFDQSVIFKKIYETEFGSPGGEPYGALIGDYEFSNHPEDVELLSQVSQVAAAAFAPFISAASPKLFGFDEYTELSKPRDLEKIFDSAEYAKWRSFRESEDSRFVTLTLPRTLARLPYGSQTKPVEAFDYEESPIQGGVARGMAHDEYCWMNSAYVLGARLTDAFAQHGWCTAIRGAEGGGKVENLPSHVFVSDDGDSDQQCPTEIGITDRREAELSKLGFLPLCHYKGTDYAVFFGAQTTFSELQDQVPQLDEQRRHAQQGLNSESGKLADLTARLEALKALQEKLKTDGKLAPWLHKHGLDGMQRLWSRLQVESGWENAIEAALRERMGALEVSRLDSIRAFASDAPPAKLGFYSLPQATAITASGAVALPALIDKVRVHDAGLQGLLAEWLHGCRRNRRRLGRRGNGLWCAPAMP